MARRQARCRGMVMARRTKAVEGVDGGSEKERSDELLGVGRRCNVGNAGLEEVVTYAYSYENYFSRPPPWLRSKKH